MTYAATRLHLAKRHTHAHAFFRLPTRNSSLRWLWLLPWRQCLPQRFPECPTLAQSRVLDVIEVVLQIHTRLWEGDTQRQGWDKAAHLLNFWWWTLTKIATFKLVCLLKNTFMNDLWINRLLYFWIYITNTILMHGEEESLCG